MMTGADFNRVNMLIAVLEKRVGYNLSNQDIYVNMVGGMKIDEPAADLGIICAIASAFKNAEISPDIALIGEVGLTGELHAVVQLEKRLNEISKLGFKKCIVPDANKKSLVTPDGLEVLFAKNVSSALKILF